MASLGYQVCLRLLRRYSRENKGAVAILFAVSMVPIIGLTGLAIDYSGAQRARSVSLTIADSAALAGVSETTVKTSIPKAQQKEASLAAAKKEFAALISTSKAANLITSTNFDAKDIGDAIEIKVCFNGAYKTTVLGAGGMPSLEFSGCSTARSAPPVYVSIYALVDASGSMGIGATYADQALMERRLGCAFACHTMNNVWDQPCDTPGASIPRGWNSQTTKCAKAIGAKTRFDVIKEALAKVTDKAQSLQRVPEQYSIAVQKFSNYLTPVHAASSAMGSVKTAVQLMTPDVRGAGTNFYKVVPEFARNLPQSGDGKSPQTPKVFAMILTDGMGSRVFEEDRCYFNGSRRPNCYFEGGWRQDPEYVIESPYVDGNIRSQAFPARLCTDLKRKNITVMTLVTEFDSSNINDSHMKSVDRVLRSLAKTGLEGCASAPEHAYRANHGPDVDRAIQAMFSNVVEKVRITR